LSVSASLADIDAGVLKAVHQFPTALSMFLDSSAQILYSWSPRFATLPFAKIEAGRAALSTVCGVYKIKFMHHLRIRIEF